MNRQYRIPTRRSLFCRIWRYAEKSWVPAIVFYVVVTAVLIVANWSEL